VNNKQIKELIHQDYNAEGAIRLTALVTDPAYSGSEFYETCVFYFYDSIDEAIDVFIENIINKGYQFVDWLES
jgi:hypothetical protein